MSKVLVVVNTKGGVGKSTIASQILPVLFKNSVQFLLMLLNI